MIIFNTISTFRTRLQNLLDIRKGVYASIPAEIKREFQSASIDTIRNNRDMILIQNEAVIVKYRLGDKRMKLSKANGYRLIYIWFQQSLTGWFSWMFFQNVDLYNS